MRKLSPGAILLFLLICSGTSSLAQDTAVENLADVVRTTQDSLRSAHTAKDVAYIVVICKYKVARYSFPVRDRLRATGEGLIQNSNADDARLYFHLIDTIAKLDRRLGDIGCTR